MPCAHHAGDGGGGARARGGALCGAGGGLGGNGGDGGGFRPSWPALLFRAPVSLTSSLLALPALLALALALALAKFLLRQRRPALGALGLLAYGPQRLAVTEQLENTEDAEQGALVRACARA